jgi:hypothetical protein
MQASVVVGTSLDGFIARSNGAFDFLPAGGGEPHGYEEFIATVDALVIGRNTYETVLKSGHLALRPQTRRRPQHPLTRARAGRGGRRTHVGTAGRHRVRTRRARHPAYLVRRGTHHPGVSSRRAHSASGHHAPTGTHRQRHRTVRCHQRRHRRKAHRDAPVCERTCQKRV